MWKKLKQFYELGVDEHLNTYQRLRLQIVNRLSVLCVVLDLVLIVLNTAIGNFAGIVIDLAALSLVLIPTLYLNHHKQYGLARYLFVGGFHAAVIAGSYQALVDGRANEVELFLLPGAIGLTILLSGKGQVIFYLLNMTALAIIKYFRWNSFDLIPGDYYKMLAVVAITYTGIYFFIIQFKTQLMAALENAEFLNNALRTNEKELKASNKAKDRLFTIVAHDLRSPLDLVKGLLDPAVLVHLEKEELISHQNTIRSRIAVLQETMNNLLNWARSQLGELEMNPVKVTVLEESKGITDLFKEMIHSKNIELEYIESKPILALVDKDHFNVIMRNIIHNAVKFTPKNGKIILEARRSNGMISMVVTDSGAGIDTEIKDRILQSQLIESTPGTEGERGSGVGLSFCHELIKKNEGSLTISDRLPAGARLEVYLPAASD